MYELYIRENGQVQQWWINFLTGNQPGSVIDIDHRVKQWNAHLVTKNLLGDKIVFQDEKDLVWFLLHWT